MFYLPRGLGNDVDVRSATASWATPQAVERLAYQGGASLFVGAIPAAENWPVLREIYEEAGTLLTAIETSGAPPAERAKKVDALEGLWRTAQLADCIPLGLDDDRHFVTIAGSRSGKGTSAIIPNLAIYPGSIVCLDPKGENATLTAARRGSGTDGCEGMGQKVFVLDPFGVTNVPDAFRAGLNPLALLNPNLPTVVNDADMLAEGLIVVSKDDRDSHWDESARNFIKGVILHLITPLIGAEPGTIVPPSLFTLRRFLTQGDRAGWSAEYDATKALGADEHDAFVSLNPSPFHFLLQEMRYNEAFSGVVSGAAETLLSCGDNERGSILSTARRNTAFLDTLGPRFVETLAGTGRTFSPDIFKTAARGASLYLCLPAERMGTHGRWLRLMIGLLLEWAYRDLSYPKCGAPFLFLLEEFHSLGHMQVIEKAAGYAAGFGVKLWAVLQDLQQLKGLYPQSWQTFLANAGAIQIFGISDHDTTTYVSKALGEIETIRHVVNYSTNQQAGQSTPSLHQRAAGLFNARDALSVVRLGLAALPATGTSESTTTSSAINQQIQIVPLLRPDEIAIHFARETGAALLLIKGRQPIWCLRVEYYDSPWFAGRYVALKPGAPKPGDTKPPPFGDRNREKLQAIAAHFRKATP